jgi:glycosyltransferase involved in cell wall biosynthesis
MPPGTRITEFCKYLFSLSTSASSAISRGRVHNGIMSPRVSVLMLTYNRPQFIAKAIESILAQQFQEWELLVVHDGPNQEIPVLMAEWLKRDDRIRYFRRNITGNIAEASNFGLAQARGEYIAVLDDDDYWTSADKLSRQIDYLDSHPDYCVCGGGVIVIDPDGREQMRYLKPERDEQLKRLALISNPMAHSTTLYRRESAIQSGGYDETLAGFQDWDLWLKLGKIGKLYNFPEYFLRYRVWQGSGSFHQSKGNTESAIRITRRYRRDYAGFPIAFPMALLYHCYSRLPLGVQRISYSSLSRLKKSIFSHRPAPTA